MRRSWIVVALVALVGLIVLVVAWVARGRKVPEPAPRTTVTTRVQAKRIARVKPSNCRPLAKGGFTCGACRDDADCPPEAGCVVNLVSGRTECQGSECKSSESCEKGAFCRVVARTSRGEPLQACVPPGTRASGAACDPENATDPAVSCGPDLLCVDGGCGLPCEPHDIHEPSTCPGSLPCVSTPSGWGCTPTCKEQHPQRQPCGDGKTCSFLSVEGPISLCTHAVGKNCLGSKGGCPPDTDCMVETNARAERTTFTCVPRCTPGSADNTCPQGTICVPGKPTGHCRRPCTPTGSAQCASGEQCKRAGGPEELWFCSAT